jgi:hypothetical protein
MIAALNRDHTYCTRHLCFTDSHDSGGSIVDGHAQLIGELLDRTVPATA